MRGSCVMSGAVDCVRSPASTANSVETRSSQSADFSNQATYEEWLQLRGIGRTFAARIIQHREKLGGFISLDQLKEIYGLPDSTFRSITPYLKFSAPIYRKISINQPNLQTILHPYLTRKQVDVLVRYRMNHGNFNNMEDLIKTNIFSKEMVEKIRPYIDFE